MIYEFININADFFKDKTYKQFKEELKTHALSEDKLKEAYELITGKKLTPAKQADVKQE